MPTFLHREVIFHTLIFAYTFSPKRALYNFPYCNSFKFDKYSHWPKISLTDNTHSHEVEYK